MKRNDATFNLMVQRMQSGELTREQAAEIYGVKPGTLNVWISRSKLGDTIPNLSKTVRNGAAKEWREFTPDNVKDMNAAIDRVFAGEISALAMSKLNPELNYRTIAKKVRKMRLDQGLPVQHRQSPGPRQ